MILSSVDAISSALTCACMGMSSRFAASDIASQSWSSSSSRNPSTSSAFIVNPPRFMSGGHNTAVRRASKGFWDAMSLAAKREDIAKGKMSAAYWANKEKW